MTVVTVYAMIGMVLAIAFTLIAPVIATALFGSQWICPVAVLGVLLFVAATIISALSMKLPEEVR